jgi:hypothetical protein
MNMHDWDDNIKMDIKDTIFIFRLNSSLKHWVKRDFSKSY